MDSADSLIRRGGWNALKKFIEDGFEEDFPDYDYDDEPLLFNVIWSQAPGAVDMALFWLDHGYDIWRTGGKESISAAHAAVMIGNLRVLSRLLEMGANVNQGDRDGRSLLRYAADRERANVVRFLLDNGADPDGFSVDPYEERGIPERLDALETPLSVAHDAGIAAMLLDAGADMDLCMYADMPDASDLTRDELLHPLSRAAYDGRADVVRLLLERGADPDWGEGQPMRFLALSRAPNPAILRVLFEAGADTDGRKGEEPLALASRLGNGKLCEALLRAGAKPVPACLDYAVRSGKLSCVAPFYERGIGDTGQALRTAARIYRDDELASPERAMPHCYAL